MGIYQDLVDGHAVSKQLPECAAIRTQAARSGLTGSSGDHRDQNSGEECQVDYGTNARWCVILTAASTGVRGFSF